MARRFHPRLSPAGLGLWFLAAVGVALSAPRWQEWWVLTDLRDRGATAPARITATGIDPSGRVATDVIRYEFLAAGEDRPRAGVERLPDGYGSGRDPSEPIRKASKGELAARYRPDDPGVHRLDVSFPERIRYAWRVGLLLLGVAAVLAVAGTALLIRGGTTPAPDPRAGS